jgi:hypothetical protein
VQPVAGASLLFGKRGLFLHQPGPLFAQSVLLGCEQGRFAAQILNLDAALGQIRIRIEDVQRDSPPVRQDLLHAAISFFRLLTKLFPLALEAFFLQTQRVASLFVLGDFELLGVVPSGDGCRAGLERSQLRFQFADTLPRRLNVPVESGKREGRPLRFV